MFGKLGSGGVIRKVGVVGVDITGKLQVGGLVGDIEHGHVVASFSTGVVNHKGSGGGLSGECSGSNSDPASIKAAWSSARVIGSANSFNSGGLSGSADGNCPVTAAYATGAVSGNDQAAGLIGGVDSTVTAVYATGAVTGVGNGPNKIRGLFGHDDSGSVNSYWDRDTSGIATCVTGEGGCSGSPITTSGLKSPTEYGTGIYANWNVDIDGETGNDDPWEFGTSSQYPVLKYDGMDTAFQYEQFDETPPELVNASNKATAHRRAEHVGGRRRRWSSTRTLDERSVPDGSAFDLTSGSYDEDADEVVEVEGDTVVLTFPAGLAAAASVIVEYTAPSSNPLQDEKGNDVADFTSSAITLTSAPYFPSKTVPDQTSDDAFEVGASWSTTQLPAASGGDGTLSYTLDAGRQRLWI